MEGRRAPWSGILPDFHLTLSTSGPLVTPRCDACIVRRYVVLSRVCIYDCVCRGFKERSRASRDERYVTVDTSNTRMCIKSYIINRFPARQNGPSHCLRVSRAFTLAVEPIYHINVTRHIRIEINIARFSSRKRIGEQNKSKHKLL